MLNSSQSQTFLSLNRCKNIQCYEAARSCVQPEKFLTQPMLIKDAMLIWMFGLHITLPETDKTQMTKFTVL